MYVDCSGVNVQDVMTDMSAHASEELHLSDVKAVTVHAGMLSAARNIRHRLIGNEYSVSVGNECSIFIGSVVPRYNTSMFGRRAFSVAGPMVWNSLPDKRRDPALSIDRFHRQLKTFLFAD